MEIVDNGIYDIIVKVEDVILEQDFEVLLYDAFIEKIVRYNHEFIESKDTSYRDPKHPLARVCNPC